VHSLREVDRLTVYGEKHKKTGVRKRVGRLVDVLFHPSEPYVVGFTVEQPDLLMMIRRADRFVALDRTEILDDRVVVNGPDAWGRAAAKRLDVFWERTVVWLGMPVRTESGKPLGRVRDATFAAEDGHLESLGLTEGITADTALGTRVFSASMVYGFEGDAVVVSDEVLAVATDGGAAAAAGKGAAQVKVGAEQAAVAAGKAAAVASAYGKSAVKAASKNPNTKKALGFLKSMTDKVVDAARLPDDDDE
jgi:uncharacterized protein YrrD